MTIAVQSRFAPGTWVVDPVATEARFSVGNFVVRTVVGTIDVRWGRLEVGADGTPTAVEAMLDTASFRTDNAKRDADMCSPKFLDAARRPDLSYASHDVRPEGDGWRVHGRLRLGSEEATVVLDATARQHADDRVVVTAYGVVDRAELGLRAPSFVIGRRVELSIAATLQLDA